jgi:hypothetical protein
MEEFVIDDNQTTSSSLTYPAATLDKSKATLTMRVRYSDQPSVAPTDKWNYADATRLSPGAISESNSTHLPPIVASKLAKPVMFPPGRSSRSKMRWTTGSLTTNKTIGIVRAISPFASPARRGSFTPTSGLA